MNSSRQQTLELNDGYKTTLKLSLHNLKKSDFGTYKCGSKNSLGESESNLKLYGNQDFLIGKPYLYALYISRNHNSEKRKGAKEVW